MSTILSQFKKKYIFEYSCTQLHENLPSMYFTFFFVPGSSSCPHNCQEGASAAELNSRHSSLHSYVIAKDFQLFLILYSNSRSRIVLMKSSQMHSQCNIVIFSVPWLSLADCFLPQNPTILTPNFLQALLSFTIYTFRLKSL